MDNNNFDEFLKESKKNNVIKLFEKDWALKCSYREPLKFYSIVQKNKDKAEDLEWIIQTILSIACPNELYDLLKEKKEELPNQFITKLVRFIYQLWDIPVDNLLKKEDILKKK